MRKRDQAIRRESRWANGVNSTGGEAVRTAAPSTSGFVMNNMKRSWQGRASWRAEEASFVCFRRRQQLDTNRELARLRRIWLFPF